MLDDRHREGAEDATSFDSLRVLRASVVIFRVFLSEQH